MTLFESQWMTIKQSVRVFITVCPRVRVVIIIMLVAERQREGSCPDMPDWIVPRCNCVSQTAEGSREHRSMPTIPRRVSWSLKLNQVSWMFSCLSLMQDLMHPSPAKERARHKKKRLVQSPNSYFMDVKCVGKDCTSGLYSVLCHWKYNNNNDNSMCLSWKQLSRLLQDHHDLQPRPDSCTLHRLLFNPLPTSRRKVQTNWR